MDGIEVERADMYNMTQCLHSLSCHFYHQSMDDLFPRLITFMEKEANGMLDKERRAELDDMKQRVEQLQREDDMAQWHKEHPTMPQQVYDCIIARKYNTLIHLIEKGASPNTPADGKSCPLIEAVKNNDEYCVNVLLGTKDINVNSQDSTFSSEHRFWRGATALHYAAVQKSQTMVTRLLAAGADPTIKNTTGETPRDLTPWKDTDYILERWESLTPEERDCKIDPKKYAEPRNLWECKSDTDKYQISFRQH